MPRIANASTPAKIRRMHILVVDDDPKIASHVRLALAGHGFDSESVASGESALERIRSGGIDAVVLDVMLEGLDGLSVVKRMRQESIQTPVLLLSARGALDERVEGLEAGADDYLPKPFAFEELVARLRALLRRNVETPNSRLQVGDLLLDAVTRIATRGAPQGRTDESRVPIVGVPDAIPRSGLHSNHDPRACLGLSLRSRHQHRRSLCPTRPRED